MSVPSVGQILSGRQQPSSPTGLNTKSLYHISPLPRGDCWCGAIKSRNKPLPNQEPNHCQVSARRLHCKLKCGRPDHRNRKPVGLQLTPSSSTWIFSVQIQQETSNSYSSSQKMAASVPMTSVRMEEQTKLQSIG